MNSTIATLAGLAESLHRLLGTVLLRRVQSLAALRRRPQAATP